MIDFSREYAVVRTGSKKTVSMRVENGSIVIRCPKHLDKYYINNIYLKHRSRLLKKLEASKDGGAEIRLFGKNFKIEKNYSGLLRRPSFEIKKDVFIENLPIDCKKSVADA
ncbi:MAG: DUF45 domain-containing protein, partial [Rickettsiales bacterium]|nr:DUF45 domain-containing protein [Rickettsiales bacterium]